MEDNRSNDVQFCGVFSFAGIGSRISDTPTTQQKLILLSFFTVKVLLPPRSCASTGERPHHLTSLSGCERCRSRSTFDFNVMGCSHCWLWPDFINTDYSLRFLLLFCPWFLLKIPVWLAITNCTHLHTWIFCGCFGAAYTLNGCSKSLIALWWVNLI